MKIEVWSDFVCPFCYIGKRRLEEAILQLPNKDKVEVEFKSFELDPNSSAYSGQSIHEMLAAKYGMSIDEAKRANIGVGQQAASVGLTFNFEEMKPTNTFDAHRLAKYAKSLGKEAELTEKLLYAYFTESKNLGDHETLVQIAESVGIDKEQALKVVSDSTLYANAVRIDEAAAGQIGVRGVPFFVINQKYSISGAQPTETFVSALQQVWQEESASLNLQDLSGKSGVDNSCTDEGCIVPEKE